MKRGFDLRRGLSLLLAVCLLASLLGCGRASDPSKAQDEVNAEDGTEETVELVIQQTDGSPLYEVIEEHAAHNAALVDLIGDKPDRPANEFHFYIANTETMRGYANADGSTNFNKAIRSAIQMASTMGTQYGHMLDYPEGKKTVSWMEVGMDVITAEDGIFSNDFYEGKHLPIVGAVTNLFTAESPFKENGLTMIVSNFVEPDFDMGALTVGIGEYFHQYEKSAAWVLGVRSEFVGELYLPYRMKGDTPQVMERIGEYNGDPTPTIDAPFYMVLVGPEAAVSDFAQRMENDLQGKKVDYCSRIYSNTKYIQKVEQPLELSVIADRGELEENRIKRAVWTNKTSYNTGGLTQHKDGYAFYTAATNRSNVTDSQQPMDAAGNLLEDAVLVRESSQVALLSTNLTEQGGGGVYGHTFRLYVYNETAQAWEEASKNEQAMVSFHMEDVRGGDTDEVSSRAEENKVILIKGNEKRLWAQLNFAETSPLSRDKIYRVEVALRLNPGDAERKQESGGEPKFALEDMSITTKEYEQLWEKLGPWWTARISSIKSQPGYPLLLEAQDVLSKTPNLQAFLKQLEEIENDDAFKPSGEIIQYVDFVFNLPEAES